jgi:hypothetical protein
MALSLAIKPGIIFRLNRKLGEFLLGEKVLLFDMVHCFRYNCALVVALSESGKFSLAIYLTLLYITPLVLA